MASEPAPRILEVILGGVIDFNQRHLSCFGSKKVICEYTIAHLIKTLENNLQFLDL